MKHAMLLFIAWFTITGVAQANASHEGRIHLSEGNYAAAANSFAEAASQRPQDAGALNNLAVARAALGDYQSAIHLFAQAHQLAPDRTDIKDNLDHLLGWLRTYGDMQAAPSDLARTLAEPPPLWQVPPPSGARP